MYMPGPLQCGTEPGFRRVCVEGGGEEAGCYELRDSIYETWSSSRYKVYLSRQKYRTYFI